MKITDSVGAVFYLLGHCSKSVFNPEYALEIYCDKMLPQIHFNTRFSSFKLALLAFHSEKLRVSRLFCIIPSRHNPQCVFWVK